MRKINPFILGGLIVVIAAVILSANVFRANFIVSLMIGIVGILIMFFALFEKKYVSTEKIVLIALLSSLASAGRVLFAAVPSVQPASFVIIITGIVFGSEMGFITGAVCALVSNLVLGQGPWTIWQVFCWGMMGFLSGRLSGILRGNTMVLGIYGLVWGFVFGWIMNSWVLINTYSEALNLETIFMVYVMSFAFDLAHGVCNLVLLVWAGGRFIKILGRVAIKYGLTTVKT